MNYFKSYFIIAFTLSILSMIVQFYNLESKFNILLFLFFGVSYILLLAIDEKYRRKFFNYMVTLVLVSYLFVSTYFELSFKQNLFVHAYGSIILFTTSFFSSLKKSQELKNIGFNILSAAYIIVVTFSFVELIYIYTDELSFAYTLAIFSSNSGFILVIISFLTQILMSEYKVLNTIALTDPLTGMNNRRGLYHLLESVIPSSNRNKCFSVITIDIDFFKKVNDTYGHDAGDIVLKKFSQMIKQTHRNTDISARFGGEEFIIILPDTGKETALVIAEKLRSNTELLNISLNDTMISITSSFGVETSCNEINIDKLFKNADKALYQAKSTGRNKVIHFNTL